METLEAILTRRSIRAFKDKKVPKEFITKMVKAAMYAPSARNYQPWHFVVTDDRAVLDKIPELHPYAYMVKEAPLAVLICGDLQIESMPEYNAINCAAATQNLLLEAHELGLGSVWLGVYPRQERMSNLSNLFELPEHIIPISLVALGYPDEKPTAKDRFKEDRIYHNKFGNSF
jgi:nitroreductase